MRGVIDFIDEQYLVIHVSAIDNRMGARMLVYKSDQKKIKIL